MGFGLTYISRVKKKSFLIIINNMDGEFNILAPVISNKQTKN